MAMLVSLTSFAAALGEGYEKVTDISKLAAGDRVVVYCDGSSIGVTGWNGSKDATVAAEGWVEYLVEAASGGVYLKDEKANNYIASPGSSNQFKYGTKGVCSVDANGVLKCNSRFLCHNDQNGNYYRMYTAIGSYKPFYVYKVVPVEVDPDATIYTVTVKSADETMGTVAGGGEYAEGKTATLEATPKTGYEFVKWSNESTDNPLQITVTGDIELTATFQAQAPITIAEANKLADNATCTLNEFTVTYVFKSYTHIQDASGYGMIYSSNFGLKAGDVVSGFTCTKASYNGLPQFIPTCKLADLTIVNGEAPAVAEVTTAPTGNYHQVVKLVNVKMATGEFTTSANKTLTATCPDGTTIAVYNNKNVTATFTADKTYNITGDVCQYSGKIQVSAYAVEEYVAPEPCTLATAINWDAPIAAEANTDKWYAVNIASAIAAQKDIALTVANPGTEAVEITVAAYANCPATEKIASATSTINAGATKTTTVKYDEFLADQAEVIYFNVITKGGDLNINTETIEPVEVMELTMTNLSVDTYGEATGLWASDPDSGIEVMLFLDAEGNLMEESSIMVSWMDYPVTGTVTKAYNEELATDVYTAELYTTVGETNYKLVITMYYVPAVATPVVVENATIDDQTEETGFMYMYGEWTDAEGLVYPVSAEVPGFDATVAEAVYKNVTVTVGGWGDEDPWLGFVQGDATITVVENVVTLTGVMSSWDGLTLDVTITGTLPAVAEPVEMVGVVKRAIQNGDEVIVLTHEADGTAHIYQVVDGVAVAEVSQEGVIAVDAENAGDLLAISDIALTEDGKLVAVNKIVCQSDAGQVKEGYKRGELKAYIWNDLAGAPAVWFTSKMSSNWYNSIQGHTMAVKGTSTNATIMVTGMNLTSPGKSRYSVFSVIDGAYVEPAVNDGTHYHFTKGTNITLETLGESYELNVSPLAENTWVLDGELVDPFEITDPLTYNTEVTAGATLNEDLGKKYNGASYVTVGENVWMIAPFATPAGDLVAVEILDITNGLGAAQYVNMLYLEESVAATAAATAVQVTEEALVVTLVADATIYTMELPLSDEPDYQMYEDAITNLVIDYDNMLLIGGPSDAFQVEVVLGLGDYDRNTDNFALLPESSISVLGSEATFIDGIASVDGIAQTALAVVHCMWNGMALEFHLTMSAAPLEATKVVVENAVIEIEKVLLWGDMYDYALKMTGVWTNEGVDYPVLVEVPVYYPEATEPSIIFSTVTVGGQGDDDPWLGFGEGDLTITTEGDKITATGIVENPMAGVAIDITISGNLTTTGLENATVTAKPVKMIKNGQLVIEKDGVQFNAQGATVK